MNNGISDWSLSCSFPPICHCFPSSHARGPLSIPRRRRQPPASVQTRVLQYRHRCNCPKITHSGLQCYTHYSEKVPASVFSLLKAPSWDHIIYPIQDTMLNGACRQGSLLTKPHRVKILKVYLLWLQLCQNWRTLQTIWNKTNIPATIRAGETQECLLFVCLQSSSSSSSPLFSGEFSEWFLLVPSCPILSRLPRVYNGILTLLNKALTQASTYYLWNDFIIPRIVHKFKSILSLKWHVKIYKHLTFNNV